MNFDKDDEIVNGEEGRDKYFFEGKEVPPPLNSNKANNNNNTKKSVSLNSAQNVVLLTDSSGIDTLDFSAIESGITLNLNLQNSAQTIDSAGTQIILQGNFEVIIGSAFDDEFTISPLPDTARFVNGGAGKDVLNFESVNVAGVDDGSTIATPGFADIAYDSIETVNLSVITGTEEAVDMALPLSFSLSNNYPNPFNPSTKIKYQIPSNVNGETSNVELIVFDILGREVATLVNEQQKPGYYEIDFNASRLTSGIYFYRIQAGNFIDTKKMVLMK